MCVVGRGGGSRRGDTKGRGGRGGNQSRVAADGSVGTGGGAEVDGAVGLARHVDVTGSTHPGSIRSVLAAGPAGRGPTVGMSGLQPAVQSLTVCTPRPVLPCAREGGRQTRWRWGPTQNSVRPRRERENSKTLFVVSVQSKT